MSANTLLLWLEGPLQAWGDPASKFLIRRTREAPTKSGVVGLLCAALGLSRQQASEQLPALNQLRMGVRVDRPGMRWWDYHTVGAGMQMRIAEGEGRAKPGAMLTRREYLADAAFAVALQGDTGLIARLAEAVRQPVWPVYLGRKSCPPGAPVDCFREQGAAEFPDLLSALRGVSWRPRLRRDSVPEYLECLLEWHPGGSGASPPRDAEVWHDVARSFDVPGHDPRLVVRERLTVGPEGDVRVGPPRQNPTPPPARPRADYRNSEYRRRREMRLAADEGLCVFCKHPATTVQHVTYRRAGGHETPQDLRSLCRLCHDAVTMIEYGLGMGLDRINPEDPKWRDRITRKREEIIRFRSLETRRRRLAPEEVE